MAKQKDQLIKPGWKPTPTEEREPPDLQGCEFDGEKEISRHDLGVIARAAAVYHSVNPDDPYKACLTQCYARYWELEKGN